MLEENYAFLFKRDKEEGDRDFIDLIKKYTVDHGFIVVDRTEARYTLQEMFFKSKAELNVEKFKIGSDKFWKDAMCSWELQLQIYKNQKKKEKMKNEDWMKISKRQLRRESIQADEKQAIYLRQKEQEEEEERNLDPDRIQIERENDAEDMKAANVSEYQTIRDWIDSFYG